MVAPSRQEPQRLTVAITGANGFIGSRLATLLASNPAVSDVVVLTRRKNPRGGAVVVRLDDEVALRAALQPCQAMIHCAFDFQHLPLNLEIARTLARVCVSTGTRMIQMSSWAVYGPVPDGDLDESGAIQVGGDAYKDVKIAIEDMLLRAAREDGLDVAILQPTIVYGPFGNAWTDSPARELLTGQVALPDRGEGLCNAVYIDDVCLAAMSAALRSDLSNGGRFLISGPAPVTWRDFLGAYENILGVQSLQLMNPQPKPAQESQSITAPLPASLPKRLRGQLALAGKRLLARHLDVQSRARLNFLLMRLLQRLRGRRLRMPTGSKLALYRSRCHVRTGRAQQELGYAPQYDLVRGMAATAPYLRRAYKHG